MDRFKALVIRRDEATKQQSVALETLGEDALMAGDVDVRVEYSTLNYKDGLLDGPYKSYDANGRLAGETTYVAGVRQP